MSNIVIKDVTEEKVIETGELLRSFVDQYRSGQAGCEMDCYNAQAFSLAIEDVLTRASAAEARVKELEDGLKPFAKYAETMDESYPTRHGGELQVAPPITSPLAIRDKVAITLEDCRRAHALISWDKRHSLDYSDALTAAIGEDGP